MAHQIDCPSCGATIKVKRGSVNASCSYCGNSVLVPEELRHGGSTVTVSTTGSGTGSGCGAKAALAVGLSVMLIAGLSVFIFVMAREQGDGFEGAIGAVTGSVYSPDLEFGGPGSGRGYFQEPECIAVDGYGRIYVGERESGRVQIFNGEGEFLDQWSFAAPGEHYLAAMSADYNGMLYLVYDSEIYLHNRESGQVMGQLRHPDGWGFEDVDVAATDHIAASWYCNRDDVLLFDESGELELMIPAAISGVTGDSELSTMVAGGNSGEIYALGSFNSAVLVFDSNGSFTDRFGNDDMFTMPFGMDVDPQGRVWISDFGDLRVFSSSGELLMNIDPGVSIYDFVIDDGNRLWGITSDDTVVMIDISGTV